MAQRVVPAQAPVDPSKKVEDSVARLGVVLSLH